MKLTHNFRWILLLLTTLLGSCAKHVREHGYREKKACLAATVATWKGAAPMREYGLQRSVQIHSCNAKDTSHAQQASSAHFKCGMGAIVSSDGYVVTAAHVFDANDAVFLLATDGPQPRPFHLREVLCVTAGDARNTSRMTSAEFERDAKLCGLIILECFTNCTAQHVACPHHPRLRGRVVRVWPERDLALLKFPMQCLTPFRIANRPPDPGEMLFLPGSGTAVDPGASAGSVVSLGKRYLYTTMPTSRGDSGGPIMNAAGDLLALCNSGTYLPWRWKSKCALVVRSDIETTITSDKLSAPH